MVSGLSPQYANGVIFSSHERQDAIGSLQQGALVVYSLSSSAVGHPVVSGLY